jgi:hypothetical protein
MQKTHRIALLFALLKFLIPFFLIHSAYDLQRDEYLYLADGSHLAWGYIEMPPLMALMGRLSMLLGGSVFMVHLWPALFGAVTMVFIARIVWTLQGGAYATFIACLAFLLSGFLRMHILFQPNILDTFFWTLGSYFILLWIRTGQPKYIYFLGLCFGLGMLSKYTMSFYIVAFWLGLLLTKERKMLFTRHFYLAMLLAVIIFLPNFIWQVVHHFPVAHHMKLLQEYQLQYVSRISFLIDQVIITLPCFFVWMIGLGHLFSKQGRPYRIFGWMYLAIVVILLIFRGKNYYAMSIYPTLLAIGAVVIERRLQTRSLWVRWVNPLVMLLVSITLVPVALPFASPKNLDAIYRTLGARKLGALNWEDGKSHPLPQDFGDMLGWKEMSEKVVHAWSQLSPQEKENTVIFCDNYGEAGAVNFYDAHEHLPRAWSDNASFLYWIPPDSTITNLILVTDDKQEMEHPFIHDFHSAAVSDSITNAYAREKGSLIIVLKGANGAFNEMFKRKIEKDKQKLRRDGD